eukprot:GILJ01009012.1.p1 GENE.GILJ01009012.1~~GILJ01009012.1.p1  ORF type:complete len:738 (-),score=110.50 GILJ01009012.1:196-2409(-)
MERLAKNEVFYDPYTFSSDFDSGNMLRCERWSNEEYFLWTAPDAGSDKTSYRTWFHFSVKGGRKGSTIFLTIKNLNQQNRLYNQGFKPVYRSMPNKPRWERVKGTCTYQSVGTVNFEIRFQYEFEHDDNEVFFAFAYPHSYTDCQNYIDSMEQFAMSTSDSTGIYFRRELLTLSLDQLRVDLLTVSSLDGQGDPEQPIEGLFPFAAVRPASFPQKQIIFVSCRVHPGETPGSFVFNGFLNFILDDRDPRAIELRKRFVFKLIPMLNPDGVARGHYRADSNGCNLNRIYGEPSQTLHPTIYAARACFLQLHSTGRLFVYVDLHGHATKRGCFIFGNALDFDRQIDNVLFAKLLSLNSPHFDFDGCNFSEQNMTAKDKRDGLSKEGSGRVSLYQASNLIHCYTLECNYNCGRIVNTIPPAPLPNSNEPLSPGYRSTFPVPKFTTESFQQVGRAIAVTLLDMCEANPYSRIGHTDFKTVKAVRDWVAAFIRSTSSFKTETVPKKKTVTTAAKSSAKVEPKKGVASGRQTRSGSLTSSQRPPKTVPNKTIAPDPKRPPLSRPNGKLSSDSRRKIEKGSTPAHRSKSQDSFLQHSSEEAKEEPDSDGDSDVGRKDSSSQIRLPLLPLASISQPTEGSSQITTPSSRSPRSTVESTAVVTVHQFHKTVSQSQDTMLTASTSNFDKKKPPPRPVTIRSKKIVIDSTVESVSLKSERNHQLVVESLDLTVLQIQTTETQSNSDQR